MWGVLGFLPGWVRRVFHAGLVGGFGSFDGRLGWCSGGLGWSLWFWGWQVGRFGCFGWSRLFHGLWFGLGFCVGFAELGELHGTFSGGVPVGKGAVSGPVLSAAYFAEWWVGALVGMVARQVTVIALVMGAICGYMSGAITLATGLELPFVLDMKVVLTYLNVGRDGLL